VKRHSTQALLGRDQAQRSFRTPAFRQAAKIMLDEMSEPMRFSRRLCGPECARPSDALRGSWRAAKRLAYPRESTSRIRRTDRNAISSRQSQPCALGWPDSRRGDCPNVPAADAQICDAVRLGIALGRSENRVQLANAREFWNSAP
jgi:hypothetical protein